MSIEAMKQALEALDEAANVLTSRMFADSAAALREAIEQAEKPVAWQQELGNILCLIHRDGGDYISEHGWRKAIDDATLKVAKLNSYMSVPQYEHPDPVAYVTGYYGGRCVIEPLNKAMVMPSGMALYTTPPSAPVQELVQCEPQPTVTEDGYCAWVCPQPVGYLMQCCECDLIHEVEFRVVKYEPRPSEEFVVVDDPNMQCQLRMKRRDDISPAAKQKPVAYRWKGELFTPNEIEMLDVTDAVPLYEHQREWVGLSVNEARNFYESKLGREALVYTIDEFLEEKNT
jgi:hypothetical protein